MPPALSNAASIIARTSAVSRFGVPFGLPWPDVLLLGIRKSPHFALPMSAAYFGTQTRRCKPARRVFEYSLPEPQIPRLVPSYRKRRGGCTLRNAVGL
jgi:hypothetical protein